MIDTSSGEPLACTSPRLSKEMEDDVYAVLGALLGMIEVIATDGVQPPPDRHRRWLDEALRYGEQLRGRVEAMMALALDGREDHFKVATYTLRRLIDHSVHGAKWTASEHGVTLSLPEDDGWGQQLVSVDVTRLDRCLRAVTEFMVGAAGSGGVVEVSVGAARGRAHVTWDGQDGCTSGARPAPLLLAAWGHVFELHGGAMTLSSDGASIRAELPLTEAP